MCFDSEHLKEETLTIEYFQARTTIEKDLSLTLILLLSPVLKPYFKRVRKDKTTSNCNREHNKATTTRDLRWQVHTHIKRNYTQILRWKVE